MLPPDSAPGQLCPCLPACLLFQEIIQVKNRQAGKRTWKSLFGLWGLIPANPDLKAHLSSSLRLSLILSLSLFWEFKTPAHFQTAHSLLNSFAGNNLVPTSRPSPSGVSISLLVFPASCHACWKPRVTHVISEGSRAAVCAGAKHDDSQPR